jgi:hypothetical protein
VAPGGAATPWPLSAVRLRDALGQRRVSDEFTVPLCRVHHVGQVFGSISVWASEAGSL